MDRKKEDLRVIKTRQAILSTFKEMVCEMDYDQITIKELTERAMINRKTFYLHYQDLDELLYLMQAEIITNFTQREISYRSMDDIKAIIREFFSYSATMPELYERIMCSGSYATSFAAINNAIMQHRAITNKGAFSSDPLVDNIVFAYFGANSPLIYRQWVKDGKKMPLEQLIETATALICGGLSAFVKEARK